MKAINQRAGQATIWLTAIAMMAPLKALAQGSRVIAPNNKFRASDDLQLGRPAVAQVERQLPTFPKNSEVDAYFERVGRRLVAALPREFLRPEFNYRFDVVNAREINAFELRRSRYLSRAKTHLQHILTAAAMNLVRVGEWLAETPRSATLESHFERLMASPQPA
jgi:predicted Zn-dependent protease